MNTRTKELKNTHVPFRKPKGEVMLSKSTCRTYLRKLSIKPKSIRNIEDIKFILLPDKDKDRSDKEEGIVRTETDIITLCEHLLTQADKEYIAQPGSEITGPWIHHDTDQKKICTTIIRTISTKPAEKATKFNIRKNHNKKRKKRHDSNKGSQVISNIKTLSKEENRISAGLNRSGGTINSEGNISKKSKKESAPIESYHHTQPLQEPDNQSYLSTFFDTLDILWSGLWPSSSYMVPQTVYDTTSNNNVSNENNTQFQDQTWQNNSTDNQEGIIIPFSIEAMIAQQEYIQCQKEEEKAIEKFDNAGQQFNNAGQQLDEAGQQLEKARENTKVALQQYEYTLRSLNETRV